MQIRVKRVYEQPKSTDGLRVLVDRLWPRGLTKVAAAVDVWAKDLAPSTELRRWFSHDDRKFAEFTKKYRHELGQAGPVMEELIAQANDGPVTLLYAAKNVQSNHAIVLQSVLKSTLPQ